MAKALICILAGLLAGLGTGFAGLSAAAFIAPMLAAFLEVDTFSAIGIALASDVLASGASALTYQRHGNTDIVHAKALMIAVLVFAVVGSMASHLLTGFDVGERTMGWWLVLASLAMGLKLLLVPAADGPSKPRPLPVPDKAIMMLCGAYIGFVCGFQGTGGGLMLLFVLNILLRVEFKKAVGTSVCIMMLTALIGAASHFALRGMPDTEMLALCAASTLVGAQIASTIANRIPPMLLKRITGGLMSVSGLAMVFWKVI